jgi:uncharacterized metal-binding protein YceD (DUF177 family)
MPLIVNLRHVETEDVQLTGQLPVTELDLDLRDELIQARQPLKYTLAAQKLEHNLLIRGSLTLALNCQCARCLKPFEFTLRLDPWTLHLPLEGEEAARVVGDCVDLTPYLREDILLEFPQHPLCAVECRGLPKSLLGKGKKPSNGNPQADVSAWVELNKLKFEN